MSKKEEINRMQNMILARFVLSRLLALGAQVKVMNLDFQTGRAVVYFDAAKVDALTMAALTGGMA